LIINYLKVWHAVGYILIKQRNKQTHSNLKKQTKMKNISKVFATAAIVIAFSNNSFAQASATASTSATIITPITIVKNTDMNFGNIAVSASVSGTVVLAPAGTRTTGGSGGVTLPSTTGTVAGADYTVSGQASYTYAITLPTTTVTLSDGSGHTMNLATFTSFPSATGTLSGSGSQDLKVGATLSVASAQTPGTYTNSTGVPVTVNYN
jgi:uncharacterized protein DUF4402